MERKYMNIYQEYAQVRTELDRLAEKQKLLEKTILEEIKGLSAPMKTEFGMFSKVVRENFTFSPKIKEVEQLVKEEAKPIQEQLKAIMSKVEVEKQKEIDTGLATKEVIVSMRFTKAKGNE